MKKVFLVWITVLLVGCNDNSKIKVDDKKYFSVNLMKRENCNHVLKEYYQKDERIVYLVCLDEIYLELDKKFV